MLSTEALQRLLDAVLAAPIDDGAPSVEKASPLTIADLIRETRQPLESGVAEAAGRAALRAFHEQDEELGTIIEGPVRTGGVEMRKTRTPEGHYRFVARAESLALRGQTLALDVVGVKGSPLISCWRRAGAGVEAEFFIPSAHHPADERTPFAIVTPPP